MWGRRSDVSRARRRAMLPPGSPYRARAARLAGLGRTATMRRPPYEIRTQCPCSTIRHRARHDRHGPPATPRSRRFHAGGVAGRHRWSWHPDRPAPAGDRRRGAGRPRTPRSAAEINQLAQALASFKNKYGDYPPSRIYLSEDGNLMPPQGNAQIATGDITYAQLGQRSIAAMRKFFPRVDLQPRPELPTGKWYDFNGDGLSVTNGDHASTTFFGQRMPGLLPGRDSAN